MRRLLIALAGTAAGLAALLGFKAHSPASPTASSGGAGTVSQGGGMSASVGGGLSGHGQPAGGGAAGSQSPAAPASAPSRAAGGNTAQPAAAPATRRAVAGAVESTPYGPMQVQLTVQGTKITGVDVLRHTDDGTTSEQIDASAIPQLNRETLAAQNGHIDAVSGASYTSAGYIGSLQNALDRARA